MFVKTSLIAAKVKHISPSSPTHSPTLLWDKRTYFHPSPETSVATLSFCTAPAHLNGHIKFNACFPILFFCRPSRREPLFQKPHMTAKCKAHHLFLKWWQKEECTFPLRRETWSIPLIVEPLTKPSSPWKVSPSDNGLFLCLLIRPPCTEPVLIVHCHTVELLPSTDSTMAVNCHQVVTSAQTRFNSNRQAPGW